MWVRAGAECEMVPSRSSTVPPSRDPSLPGYRSVWIDAFNNSNCCWSSWRKLEKVSFCWAKGRYKSLLYSIRAWHTHPETFYAGVWNAWRHLHTEKATFLVFVPIQFTSSNWSRWNLWQVSTALQVHKYLMMAYRFYGSLWPHVACSCNTFKRNKNFVEEDMFPRPRVHHSAQMSIVPLPLWCKWSLVGHLICNYDFEDLPLPVRCISAKCTSRD